MQEAHFSDTEVISQDDFSVKDDHHFLYVHIPYLNDSQITQGLKYCTSDDPLIRKISDTPHKAFTEEIFLPTYYSLLNDELISTIDRLGPLSDVNCQLNITVMGLSTEGDVFDIADKLINYLKRSNATVKIDAMGCSSTFSEYAYYRALELFENDYGEDSVVNY